MSPGAAVRLQAELSDVIIAFDDNREVSLVAGIDVSVGRQGGMGRAAVVVLRYPSLELVEESVNEGPVTMPYIPGLLSFRELPLILPAIQRLRLTPDLFIVDGQGIAHPRRLGIAAHLGLFTSIPTIGCAKSRLCGSHREVGAARGDSADLMDGDTVIGRVMRTREKCKPVYVSVGHMINLETAASWVLTLCRNHRLPEPVRQAHIAAGQNFPAGQPTF